MANEATLQYETELALPMDVADVGGIEKGAILSMADPFTASGSVSASGSIIAGIAAAEKISGDGVTKIPVYRKGIFIVSLSGSCGVGDDLTTSESTNHVQVAEVVTAAVSGSQIIGTALEDGATGETILMELKA